MLENVSKLIFDADDTLWENNKFYIKAAESFFDICEDAGFNRNEVVKEFDDFELKVVREKGYGSKNYIYILEYLFDYFQNLDHNKLIRKDFDIIITEFKNHANHPMPLLPGVESTLKQLKEKYLLYVLTKGNIQEQKQKVTNSGLTHYFNDIFVVPEKDDKTYRSIIAENNWDVNECCMIGNSPKSDINPALRSGMYAIFIPYPFTWKLDDEKILEGYSKLCVVKDFPSLMDLIK